MASFQSALLVTLIGGETNLKSLTLPYFKMKLLGKAFRSDPTLALAPNLRAAFHLACVTDAQLEVSLRTKAIFGSTVHGVAVIPLASLKAGEVHEDWYSLKLKDRPDVNVGRVRLILALSGPDDGSTPLGGPVATSAAEGSA